MKILYSKDLRFYEESNAPRLNVEKVRSCKFREVLFNVTVVPYPHGMTNFHLLSFN